MTGVTQLPGRKSALEAFQPFTPADWIGKRPPDQQWMVEGCFLRGTVAILSGDGGLGKSLLLQQLMTCAALGRDWLGMKVQQCRTMAVFCEDDRDELHRRQWAINLHYDCDMGDIAEDLMIESRAGRDSVLMRFGRWGDDGQTTPLFHQIAYKAKEFGAQLLFLDTVADVFSGNEVDRNQPRRFISELRKLAIAMEGCVVLTQHPSVDGLASGTGRSGSTAWNNSARSRIYLTEDKKVPGNQRVLKTMKNNSAARGGKIALKWDRGVFVREAEQQEFRDWTEPEGS